MPYGIPHMAPQFFTPRSGGDGTGLVVQWDSSQEAYSNNDPVGSMTDWSGNSHTATAAGSARPTFKTNIQNGLPAILSDGSANIMAPASGIAAVAGDNTIFIVGANHGAGNDSYSPPFGYGDASTDAGAPLFYKSGGVGGGYASYPRFPTGGNFDPAGSYVDDVFHVYCLPFFVGTWSFYLDGSVLATGTASANPSNTGVSICGEFRPTGNRYWNGYLCEVRIYDTALNSTDVAIVQAALKAKWGTP